MLRTTPDEALIQKAKTGDGAALDELITVCSPFIELRANAFCCDFCEKDDLMQEGLLALLSAVRGFDKSRSASFRTYLGDCVDNRMISFLRRCARQNRASAGSEAVPAFEQDGLDPEAVVLGKEGRDDIISAVTGCLSDFERRVLTLYIEGLTYVQIGERLNKSQKSVGNALCRIKAKLSRRLNK